MLKALLRRKSPPAWTLPAGERVYAIGDVHGCLDQLKDLVARIDADDAARGAARTTLVFVGDLVDRGPDSAGVVGFVRDLAATRGTVRHLMGNHEEIMLGALDGDLPMLKLFAQFGGRETMLSYGLGEDEWQACDWDALVAHMADAVPAADREFLARAADHVVIGDYLFVHAGVRPGIALADQRPQDLRWIRSSFLGHKDSFGHMVIHGHTISERVDERWNRVGIDTGCYASGVLTAIGIEADRRWFLSTAPD